MRSTIATRTIYMYLPSQCRSSRFTSGEYHPMKNGRHFYGGRPTVYYMFKSK